MIVMKAQYVGDIGDFGKLLLLKHLAECGFTIGVNWMMTQNDDGADGVHRNYIDYRGVHCLCCCDIELLAKTAPLARRPRANRTVNDLEDLIRSFAPSTIFYKGNFDDNEMRIARSKQAFEKLNRASVELVFFDPDNGIQTGQPLSPKHVYLGELQSYWEKGKSLLIYHHLPQRRAAEPAIHRWTEKLRRFLVECQVTHYRFRRGTGRVYFLCVQPRHMSLFQAECADLPFTPLLFTKSDWARRRRDDGKVCRETHEWFN
jgi:hypothetical protein